jgi:hypothetical protein
MCDGEYKWTKRKCARTCGSGGGACVPVAPRTGNAMVGANAMDGETLREVLHDARELPGAAEITALETAALSGAREGVPRSEIRALAVTAMAQLGQIAQKVTRLAALLGGESGGTRS